MTRFPRRCFLLPAIVLMLGSPAFALDTIYVVRHAEKVDFWPADPSIGGYRPLADEGVRTAQQLAVALEKVGVAAIYTSRTTRAIATAMPLAERTGVPVIADDATTDPVQMDSFIAEAIERHAGDKAILIVAHSNTIPELILRLGAEAPCLDTLGLYHEGGKLLIEGYGDLWKAKLDVEGCEGIQRLRIASPD